MKDKLEIARKYIELPENFDKGNILLVSPPWKKITYLDTKVKAATLHYPTLNLPTIATPLLQKGYNVKILDLDLYDNPYPILEKTLKEFDPILVGITCNTPFFNEAVKIANLVKQHNKKTITVIGGPHSTTYPEEFLEKDCFDYTVIGEGDFVLSDILDAKNKIKSKKSLTNIAFIEKNKIIKKENKTVENLDNLPIPAWHLMEVEKYKTSYILSKKNPAGPIETSRGCPGNCSYCNKKIFGWKFRPKSPERVIKEMKFMLDIGFKEIFIEDDLFSKDLVRAKKICDMIIEHKLKFPWMLMNGIRVDSIDLELLQKFKKAGCYRVSFGIESGNQQVLNDVSKGITLDQIRNAVKLTKIAKIETFGFFMLALPADTKKTMQQTIDFAKELDLDVAKFAITIPYPGTRLYQKYEEQGLINTKDWSDYLQHKSTTKVYQHPNLDWETIEYYYKKSFREYYLRPSYIIKRFKKSIREGTIFKDMKAFIQTEW